VTRSGTRARVGVIGTGWWATTAHLPALVGHPDAELVGVADLDGDRARRTADHFDIPFGGADHGELLELGLDGVVIATPHDTHYELTRDALLADVDVLVEKPMVIEPEHGRELVALARERGRRLHVGYPFPYTRHALALEGAIAAGELGEIVLATSLFASAVLPLYRGDVAGSAQTSAETLWATGEATYSEPTRGGGQLLTQVTHSASLLFFLTRMQPRTVFAVTDLLDTAVDVVDAITFQTEAGAAGSVASTGTVDANVEEYRIFGTEGHAALSTSEGTLTLKSYAGGSRTELPLEPTEIYPAHAPAQRLVDAILGRAPVAVPGELGLLTVEFLAAARESATTGEPTRLGATIPAGEVIGGFARRLRRRRRRTYAP
jgi:predicted dehydrogenase